MAAVQLKTFSDLYTAVCEELKIQASDSVSIARIKRMMNMTYQDLVSKFTWDWARGFAQITLNEYITETPTILTQFSDVVTLNAASAISLQDYEMSMDGSTTIYHVRSHVAGSATVYLATPFAEVTVPTATVKFWQQRLALPPDCLQVLQVLSPYIETPLDLMGIMDMRRYISAIPKLVGRPQLCAVQEFVQSQYYAALAGAPTVTQRASKRFEKTLQFSASMASYLEVGDRIQITQCATQPSYNGEVVVAAMSTGPFTALTPTATWISGNSYITVNSAAGITANMLVTSVGAGFPAAPVTVISVSGTAVYLSAPVTATAGSPTTTVFNNNLDTITYVNKANYDEALTADTSPQLALWQQRPAEQEYREMVVHPAMSTETITLSIDYKRRVIPLENDTDEPWMPLEDREVLLHGTLARAWKVFNRNPEAASQSATDYTQKWNMMKGKLINSSDFPRLIPSQTYLESKRRRNSKYRWRRF